MMEKNNAKISVLMAVYNTPETFLRKSIESILRQNFQNFEFLIIDDGSTDKKCLEILDEYAGKDDRIQLLRNEANLGLAKSLNLGLKKSQGKYIARIDSDDMADMRRLEKQFYFMEKNPDHALCGSWSRLIDETDEIIGKKKFPTDYAKIKKNLLFFNFFTHSSLFFRKDIAVNLNGYAEDLKRAQDYDFLLKISAYYPIANLPEFLCWHRLHSESLSAKGKKEQEWCALIARWRAIFRYGYPKRYFLKIIPAFFYFFFVPYFVEKQIFKWLWQK